MQMAEAEAGGRDAGDDGVVGGCPAGIAAVLDQAGVRVGLLPEIANRDSLDLVEKLVIVGRKKSFGPEEARAGHAGPARAAGRMRIPVQRRADKFPQAGHLSEELRREAHGAKLPLIHLTNLNDPGPRNDHGEETMVTGMVTPAEPKDLDERKSETKNLLCKLAS